MLPLIQSLELGVVKWTPITCFFRPVVCIILYYYVLQIFLEKTRQSALTQEFGTDLTQHLTIMSDTFIWWFVRFTLKATFEVSSHRSVAPASSFHQWSSVSWRGGPDLGFATFATMMVLWFRLNQPLTHSQRAGASYNLPWIQILVTHTRYLQHKVKSPPSPINLFGFLRRLPTPHPHFFQEGWDDIDDIETIRVMCS